MDDVTVGRLARHFELKIEDHRRDADRMSTREGKLVSRVAMLAYQEALIALQALRQDPSVALTTDVGWERQDVTCARCKQQWSPEPFDVIEPDAICGDCQDLVAHG